MVFYLAYILLTHQVIETSSERAVDSVEVMKCEITDFVRASGYKPNGDYVDEQEKK